MVLEKFPKEYNKEVDGMDADYDKYKKSKLLSVLLSLFIPGLGQIYLGEFFRGLKIFIFVIVGVIIPIILPFIWIYGMADAYRIAKNQNLMIDSIKHLKERLEFNPYDYDAWAGMGIMFIVLGNHTRALNCFDNALSINPSDIDSWIYKANLLYGLKRYSEACECYDKALELNPHHLEARRMREKAYRKIKT